MSAARRTHPRGSDCSAAPKGAKSRLRRSAPPKAPTSAPGGYIAYAEASLAAAAAAPDLVARALHEEECKLWLMLAAQRRAIEGVVERHVADADQR